MTATVVHQTALRACALGLCVVPPTEDGEKKPTPERVNRRELIAAGLSTDIVNDLLGKDKEGRWRDQATTWAHLRYLPPDVAKLDTWYADGRTGIGLACGRASHNLEVLDFDDSAIYQAFKERAAASGLGELVERLEAGYSEVTPGDGYHLPYICPAIAGNQKLARRPGPPDAAGHPTVKGLIETRGDGGYIIIAPSNGRVHPTGGMYRLLRGDLDTIATVTPDERDDLLELARTFDEMPREQVPEPKGTELRQAAGPRPGDVFNERATWGDILEPHGWRHIYDRGDEGFWRRPDKDRGISATTDYKGSGLLYVFSSSTAFESERGYSKFSAHALLDHGGDFKAAARAIAERYGMRREPAALFVDEDVIAFPLEVLPEAFRRLVTEGATSLAAPPDFIAIPLLAGAGAAIGNALEIELKPGYYEGANVFAGVVGPPGSRKTPAAMLALGPIQRLQRRQAADFDEKMRRYEAGVEEREKGKHGGHDEKAKSPVFRHLFTTDATTEAVASILGTTKGLLLAKDELTGWVRSMDQYRSGGRGADRQHFLSMWSRSPIKVDRKSNPRPIFVSRPHLSVVGGIQPDLLPDLADAAQREDGFLDRILFGYPDPVPDVWTELSVAAPTIAAVDVIFERLYGLTGESDGEGDDHPRVVKLSEPARRLWSEWYTAHAAETQVDGFPHRLAGPWAKMSSQLARLALILHALRNPVPEQTRLQAETLGNAGDLIDYFKSHARRVYKHLQRPQRNRQVTILQALKERGALTQSEILRDVFQRNIAAEALRSDLEELVEAGLVTREIIQGPMGRPTTVWRAV